MPNENTMERKLIQFIHEDILEGEGNDLKNDDLLFELGIIDSFSLASLIAFIGKEFKVDIPDEKILPNHFKDVKSIAMLIKSSLASS